MAGLSRGIVPFAGAGRPQPAIATGIVAQQVNLTLREPLLEAVAQAPTERLPLDIEQQAYDALVRVERYPSVKDGVRALVLYTWLITASQDFLLKIAGFQHNLGNAYSDLPGGDRQENLKWAIGCFEAALQVYTREAFPVDWAMTQNNLGNAYRNLPGGDRQDNLKQAIACYEAALQVRTREAFPVDWAMTQNNLGNAYSDLPGGDREENLMRAIACYEVALQTFRLVRIDFNVQVVSRNLERAKEDLENLKQD